LILNTRQREDFDIDKLSGAVDSVLEWRSDQVFVTSNEDIDAEDTEDDDDLNIIQCLTPPAFDRLGRPVVLVRLSNVQGSAAEIKQYILKSFESLRLQLMELSESSDTGNPMLQCVFVVDIANAGGVNVVRFILF